MKTEQPKNPPAFPATDTVSGQQRYLPLQQGMDLRDYFAAKAMQALIGHFKGEFSGDLKYPPAFGLSEQSYNIADLMLKQREQ